MRNLKPTLLTVAAMLAIGFSASSKAAEEPVKVGIANLAKAIQESKKGKAARATLEKEGAAKQKEITALENELKKLQEDIEKKQGLLSEKALMEKQKEFQMKFGQYQQIRQTATMELQKREAELTRPIVEALRKLVPEISRKQKLDLVFEGSAGSILYSKSQIDITEELITLYDEKK